MLEPEGGGLEGSSLFSKGGGEEEGEEDKWDEARRAA